MSQSDDVRFSVVVTTHRRDDLLRQALTSLSRQTIALQDIVVVDDGGPGSAAEVVAAFGAPFSYHWQANAGQQAARNRGLECSRGQWVCYLDDDDLWTDDRHAWLLQATQDPRVDAWFSDAWRFTADGDLPHTLFEEFESAQPGYFPRDLPSPLPASAPAMTPAPAPGSVEAVLQTWPDFPIGRLLPTGPFWPSMMAVRREVVQAIGGWKPSLRGLISEDLEFCYRLCRHAAIGLIRRPTVRYRCHPGNESHSEYRVSQGRAEVWRQVLQGDEPDPADRAVIESGLADLHQGLIWQAWRQGDLEQVIRSWRSLPRGRRHGMANLRYLVARVLTASARASRGPREWILRKP